MKIETIKNEFIERYKDYTNDVNNFFYYLKKQYGVSVDSSNIELIMQGIETEEIKKSLGFLVDEGIYKKEESAKKYATAIGQFFMFIKENSSFKNKDLFDEIMRNGRNDDSYIARMMVYIEKCNELKPKESIDIMNRNQVLSLLEWCDGHLEDEWHWEDELGYKRASAALGIKMMLLYGLTYRRVRSIKTFQVDLLRNEIEIKGFKLRLPVRLGKQMARFLQYREENNILNADLYLFTDRYGEVWTGNTSSSGIPGFLNTQFGVTSLTGVVKYGISQLLLAGLNDHIIKEITGASDLLISGCILNNEKDWYREINNKLVTVDLYYEF